MKINTLAAFVAGFFCSSIWAYTIEFITPFSERLLFSQYHANKYYLKPTDKKVQWIFGYARFVKDQWVSMCEKTYKIKPKFLCK
ncbi:MAG: hypothetical protein ACOVP4_05565 [Bacteriovoracaceae bacterium]|jgi:hypothetical protein